MNSLATPGVKVIITDNTTLFAQGLEELVSNLNGFTVIGRAANGKVLMQMLNRLQPDIVLLDVLMPVMDGFEAALEIRKKYPLIKIVFMSSYFQSHFKQFITENNFEGFINKDIDNLELQHVLTEVMNGRKVFNQSNQPEQIENVESADTDLIKFHKLTNSEKAIISLLKQEKLRK